LKFFIITFKLYIVMDYYGLIVIEANHCCPIAPAPITWI
jgi:hypothetical protein